MALGNYKFEEASFTWDFERDGDGFAAPFDLGEFVPANSIISLGSTLVVSQPITGPGPARWNIQVTGPTLSTAVTPIFNPPSAGPFVFTPTFVIEQSQFQFISTGAAILTGRLTAIVLYLPVQPGDI